MRLLQSRSLSTAAIVRNSPSACSTPQRGCVKTRYRQADVDCTVRRAASGGLEVHFDTPQWAVTPGQYAVFYAGDECLGGAAISAALPARDDVQRAAGAA